MTADKRARFSAPTRKQTVCAIPENRISPTRCESPVRVNALAGAKTADPDNAGANARGGVLLLKWANKFGELVIDPT
jgi:hypothetical protein